MTVSSRAASQAALSQALAINLPQTVPDNPAGAGRSSRGRWPSRHCLLCSRPSLGGATGCGGATPPRELQGAKPAGKRHRGSSRIFHKHATDQPAGWARRRQSGAAPETASTPGMSNRAKSFTPCKRFYALQSNLRLKRELSPKTNLSSLARLR